jgi:hypothetical protein
LSFGKQDGDSTTSVIMDVDYDEEDAEVSPVVFSHDVDETLTSPAAEPEVSFTHH